MLPLHPPPHTHKKPTFRHPSPSNQHHPPAPSTHLRRVCLDGHAGDKGVPLVPAHELVDPPVLVLGGLDGEDQREEDRLRQAPSGSTQHPAAAGISVGGKTSGKTHRLQHPAAAPSSSSHRRHPADISIFCHLTASKGGNRRRSHPPSHPPPRRTFITLFQSSLEAVLRCGFWREK